MESRCTTGPGRQTDCAGAAGGRAAAAGGWGGVQQSQQGHTALHPDNTLQLAANLSSVSPLSNNHLVLTDRQQA